MPFIKKLKPAFYFASIIYLLSILNSANTAHAVLPDSGQTKCYNNTDEIPCPESGQPFYGQDGNYHGPQPAYHVSDDGLVVTDLNTGLMWQQTHFSGGITTWATALSYCDNLDIGGYSDWRLPSIIELVSIIDFGRFYPSCNPVFNCSPSYYWSATLIPNMTYYVLIADFLKGDTTYTTYTDTNYGNVRCVRNQAVWGEFVNNNDGTVTDNSTDLIWQQESTSRVHTWQSALSYCEALDLAGHTDWRLPNIRELQNINNPRAMPPFIGDRSCWSSTSSTASWYPDSAWGIADIGFSFLEIKSDWEGSARCVRGGQFGSMGHLDIMRPNGREVLIKGENYNITWNSQNVTGTIQIDLYKGGRALQYLFRQISTAAPNTGNYRFIPSIDIPNGNDYLIRISANGGSVQDFSRAFFTITDIPPNATRSAPWNLLLLLNE